MSEPSPILRALRPRTINKRKLSQKPHKVVILESAGADDATNQMGDITVDDVDSLNVGINNEIFNKTINNNSANNGYIDNDNDDVDDDDDDDDDDDEDEDDANNGNDKLQFTVKEEPEDNSSDQDIVTNKKYECKSCLPPFEFNTLTEYLQHLKIHQQKTKCRKCPHCNFICQHPKRLARHISTSHKNISRDNTSEAECSTYNRCSMCSFIAIDRMDLNEHNKFHHLKRRFFRCVKCSYMTHVRARYTKHVKYHSMPMIKCDDCDFRTPYKWNLDRHTRNHGGGGTFQCRVCNFTADIRQSLTVHETNHHDPPIGHSIKRFNNPLDRKQRSGVKRYNQVGASDFCSTSNNSQNANYVSPSKSSIRQCTVENTVNETSVIADAECIALRCEEKGCQFITAWDSEMQRHLIESHAPLSSSNKSRKPIPMLIPLSPENKANDVTSVSSSSIVKVPRVRVRPELAKIARDTEIAKLCGNLETTNMKKEVGATNSFKKRNALFFDKIKERLMATSANTGSSQVTVSNMEDLKCWCTFEASSMEELSRHKMTHHTALSVSVGVARCPKCRRRCKSSTDLQVHMQLCQVPNDHLMINNSSQENTINNANYASLPHYGDFEFSFQGDWDANSIVGGPNSSGSSVDGTSGASTRRVFKCPHCPFWASTASRFHVHIVGHLNRKPFECSLCQYRSNWRWDITKHIKLKAARDPAHLTARVLMTDETGRRNYSKYNKYLTQMDQQSTDEPTIEECCSDEPPNKIIIMRDPEKFSAPPSSTSVTTNKKNDTVDPNSTSQLPSACPTVKNQGQSLLKSNSTNNTTTVAISVYSTNTVQTATTSTSAEETRRTLWKCKRCNFRDPNKEMVLIHVKSHYESNELSKSEKSNVFACNNCPFVADDLKNLAMHQVHHRPNLEAIFKCYLCPYYVSTKAELLEHARLHGEELAAVHQRTTNSNAIPKKSNSPHQTISSGNIVKIDVPVQKLRHLNSEEFSIGTTTSNSNRDGAPPLLLDTRALPDTPLVWVSRANGTFAKMLKCRHCPHVSSRRAEVRDHETMHSNTPSGIDLVIACPDCSFSCNRHDIMDAHTEMHLGALGTVHCLVDDSRTDAQQLDDLTTLLGLSETPMLGPEPDMHDSRLVHCCGKCPARFLCEKELRIHLRYHCNELAYSCQWCSYAARQPSHLLAHQKAHSNEYQERTRYLLSVYGHSQRYPPPKTTCLEISNESDEKSISWIVVEMSNSSNNIQNKSTNSERNSNQVFTCAKCPARYFKLDALEYHMTLHGSKNRFQCSECDYSSKTAQNLMKHQVVHKRHTETNDPTEIKRFHSQLDPQFGTLMHGNPNFIYQGCLRNGRFKEKRYKCHKCPTAFEKREQYRVHLTLHGAKQRYRCDTCDYSVKYYANYVQHLKKHQANSNAQASRETIETPTIDDDDEINNSNDVSVENVIKTRRKSTISTANPGSNSLLPINTVTMSSASNQDKQSILLMQKKGVNIITQSETDDKILRCHECPFSAIDKDAMDAHKRRHGLERLTSPCPHCNYVPRKDENINDHVKLHFTRLYRPESYLVVEFLSLMVRKICANTENNEHENAELLFSECADGKYLPIINTSTLSITVTNGNNSQEKVIVDPNTGETTHRFNL